MCVIKIVNAFSGSSVNYICYVFYLTCKYFMLNQIRNYKCKKCTNACTSTKTRKKLYKMKTILHLPAINKI